MSFAFKPISPSDITVTEYSANKKYSYLENELSGSGIRLYIGENNPINTINSFDPINDNKTSLDEYKRLVFSSIKHLFYKKYIESGDFNTSSSYEDYLQNTLYSGSYTTNLRRIENITGSSFSGINSIYNTNLLYDETALYDDATYDSDRGTLANIISVDKNIFGDKILPNTFIISDDSTYVRDDGEGNIFDYSNESNYNNIISLGTNDGIYIGNIFYSLGLIVITNYDYLCILGSPPTAINDYISYYNYSTARTFDILGNDFSDCGGIDYSSVNLLSISGSDFPDCYIDFDNNLYVIRNQKGYIPGNYQIGYTIKNYNNEESNIGLINLDIKSLPTVISNFTSSIICKNNITPISMSFKVDKGVPVYEYSFDNSVYYPISGFFNTPVSTSYTPNTSSNILYIKDYIGDILEYPFTPFYPNIDYITSISKSPTCSNTGSIYISSSNGLYFILNNEIISRSFNTNILLPTGSYTASLYSIYGCIETTTFDITKKDPIIYTLSTQSISCYNNSDGIVNITDIQGGNSREYFITLSSGSYSYSASLNNNLNKGVYSLIIEDRDGCQVSSSINLTAPLQLIHSITSSLESKCFHKLELNGVGGILPYKYIIKSPTQLYISDSGSVELIQDNLSSIYITSSIMDNNGCVSTEIYTQIYGRQYEYSGSSCEQI